MAGPRRAFLRGVAILGWIIGGNVHQGQRLEPLAREHAEPLSLSPAGFTERDPPPQLEVLNTYSRDAEALIGHAGAGLL
jgi:hypothetical protein